MTVAATASRGPDSIARGACGTFTGDGGIATITLGFRPKNVKLVNITGVVVWEKIDGMLATQTLMTVTAGTLTVNTTSAVVLTATGFTVSAAAAVSTNLFVWSAE